MATRTHEHYINKPLPSPTVPWLVILGLIACMVLVYMSFLRPEGKLLGGPLKKNTYIRYLQQHPAPAPPAKTAPAKPAAGGQASRTAAQD